MAQYHSMDPGRQLMGRLDHGADLLAELKAVCVAENITLGRVEAIGAVQRARLGYYDQGTRQYHFFDVPKPLEITAMLGNVSLREGEPMVHAHVTFADEKGRAFGGHLAEGTVVFACEFSLLELKGEQLHRGFDAPTGLPLWKM